MMPETGSAQHLAPNRAQERIFKCVLNTSSNFRHLLCQLCTPQTAITYLLHGRVGGSVTKSKARPKKLSYPLNLFLHKLCSPHFCMLLLKPVGRGRVGRIENWYPWTDGWSWKSSPGLWPKQFNMCKPLSAVNQAAVAALPCGAHEPTQKGPSRCVFPPVCI